MITLGVQDFRRERDFYQDLGWPLMFDSDVFVAFELQGAVLTLVDAPDPNVDRTGMTAAPIGTSRVRGSFRPPRG
jgi:catechol 2,3-dioxygenase-like lactoylglutathione lyase family enzyme